MSKTVYLIVSGGFLAFGPGCSLTVDSCSVRAFSPAGFGVTLFSATQKRFSADLAAANARLAIWASAIASAPDGALLRWDDELHCVVDELAPADVFDEEPLPGSEAWAEDTGEEIDLRENEVPDDCCPACGGNGLDTPYAAGCGRCGA